MRTILTVSEPQAVTTTQEIADNIASTMTFDIVSLNVDQLPQIDALIDEHDSAILIVGIDNNKNIQKHLNQLREIRIPYIFVKPGQTFNLRRIALPVTLLMEEKEKGPYTSSIARHYNTPITIYKPKDYGTKAQQNINAITSLFDTFSLTYEIEQGTKDSFGIERQTLKLMTDEHNLLVITASRDYGLDDLIFGPKERKIIQNATIPVMLINPRADLYTLCD